MATMSSPQNSQPSMAGNAEQPPKYQEYQPPEDYYAPRVRDFQPPTPEIQARNAESDAESVLPSYDVAARGSHWGRYRTEQEYLAALRAFVEEKAYTDGGVDGHGNSVGLIGFYGAKTGADYANQPGPLDGRRKKPKKSSTADRTDVYAGLVGPDADSKPPSSFWQRIRRDR